jgi:NADH:ubiquinone oxidoreductase subunit 2 (subunit N)
VNLLLLLAPIVILAGGAIVLMLIDAFQKEEGGLAMPTALLHFVAAASALALWKRGIPADTSLLHGYLVVDKTAPPFSRYQPG